jgi:autotransporter-associated beta strand protein
VSFTHSNSYSGGTTVSAGTLLLGNSAGSATGSGAVTVNSGATLASGGGSVGIVSGPVTVSGTLSPGNGGAGLLTLNGNLTLNSTSTSTFSLGANTTQGTTYSAIFVNGGANAFSLGGTLALNFTLTQANGTQWTLFGGSYGGATSGDFSQLSIGGSYTALAAPTLSGRTWSWSTADNGSQSWTFNEDSGVLAVSAVPEPRTVLLLGLFALVVLGIRMRTRA